MCITENRDAQRLVGQVVQLQSKLKSLESENKELEADCKILTVRPTLAEFNLLQSELDKAKEALKEAEGALVDSVKLFVKEVDKHRWIPVAERLPERGKQVVYCDMETGYVYVGYLNKPNQWWYFGVNTDKEIAEKDITHWRPIILPASESAEELE